jgi:predicted ABC-type ATPase
LIAGPNGSGKTSAYEDTNIAAVDRPLWIINPDRLTRRLQTAEHLNPQNANLEAVRRVWAWLEASIRAHQSIGVETVLSTDKYRQLVLDAKALGFEVLLIYVTLDTVERNIERVKFRVKKGGHDVPEERIRARRDRSIREQMPWFLQHADRAWLYDNSGAKPRLIGIKQNGTITLDDQAIQEIRIAVESIRTE